MLLKKRVGIFKGGGGEVVGWMGWLGCWILEEGRGGEVENWEGGRGAGVRWRGKGEGDGQIVGRGMHQI